MEINEQTPVETGRQANPMELPAESVVYLNETRKWTTFLAVLGFIFMGLMVILALFMGTLFSTLMGDKYGNSGSIPGIVLGGIYLIFAVIYFFPILYLYKFSTSIKKAIDGNSSFELSLAFRNLKSHYKFMGILVIVMLSIYVLGFIIAIIAGAASAFM